MKKILLFIGFVVGISLSVNAQHFTTSFGLQLNWGIPSRVENVIHHDYYGYDMVHASRVSNIGFDFFDIVLRRGDIYIEVSVRNDGFITRRSAIMDYPLYQHACGSSCGYHNTYYTANYNGCNSHSHSGHNHVVYYNNNHNNGHGQGHAYGKHKNGHGNGHAYGKHKNEKYESHNDSNKRQVQKSTTYTRRDRYYDSNNHGNDSRNRNSGDRNRVKNTRTTSSRRTR